MIRFLRRIPLWAFALGGFVALVVALWLPFGLRTGGTYEEWYVLKAYDSGGNLSQVWPNRPLIMEPYRLAFILTPGSFVGLNFMQVLFLVGKGFCAYLLLRRLVPANPALAFATGALLIVDLAGDGQFSLRITSLHLGVLSYLLATCLLVSLWQRFRWRTLCAMLIVEAVSLATYDAGILLMFFSPLLLVWVHKGINRRLLRYSAVWSVIPLFFLYLLIQTSLNPASYQGALFANGQLGPGLGNVILQLSASVARAYNALFQSGWADAVQKLSVYSDTRYPVIGGVLALVLFAVMGVLTWRFHKRQAGQAVSKTSAWAYVRLAVIGLLAVLFGFATYLPTGWRDSDFRTLFYSSWGATLTITVVCFLISRFFRRWRWLVFGLLLMPLFATATVRSLAQFQSYYDLSQKQFQMLSDIVRQAPSLKPKTMILFIDAPPYILRNQSICIWESDCIKTALQDIYPMNDFQVAFCFDQTLTRYPSDDICRFNADEVALSIYNYSTFQHVSSSYPYSSVVAFLATDHGFELLKDISAFRAGSGESVYDPAQVIDYTQPLPPRVHTLFPSWPFHVTQTPAQSFHVGFDRSIPGYGWTDPVGNAAWTGGTVSTLDCLLTPDHTYEITFRILGSIRADIWPTLTLSVNGQPLKLDWTDDAGAFLFKATLPRAVVALDSTRTHLVFRVDKAFSPKSLGMGGENGDIRLLGVYFNWLRIEPKPITPTVTTLHLAPDQPVVGAGWSSGSFSWMVSANPVLETHLSPDRSYTIELPAHSLQPDIVRSLTLSVNGQPITLSGDPDANGTIVFKGVIPQAVAALDPDLTHLEFHINRLVSPSSLGINGDTRGLGVIFDWLHIDPA